MLETSSPCKYLPPSTHPCHLVPHPSPRLLPPLTPSSFLPSFSPSYLLLLLNSLLSALRVPSFSQSISTSPSCLHLSPAAAHVNYTHSHFFSFYLIGMDGKMNSGGMDLSMARKASSLRRAWNGWKRKPMPLPFSSAKPPARI